MIRQIFPGGHEQDDRSRMLDGLARPPSHQHANAGANERP